jgi:serine-type D-Ala-D-Ala carboxypeptidase
MQKGVATGVFPGAVLLVAKDGEIRFERAYGHADNLTHHPVHNQTVFDLASLTKPLATTLGVVKLLQEKKIELHQAVGSILAPFKKPPRDVITVHHLLGHSSGLPDYRPYYLELEKLPAAKRREALRSLLAKEPLCTEPGQKVCYSDLGFMLLSWIVEAVTAERLDHYVQNEIYNPLSIDLFFQPLDKTLKKQEYAACENCAWRGRVLEGVVSDENAYVVGGIEGHAGLFGTAGAVNDLLTVLLRTYCGTGEDGLFQSTWLNTIFKRHADIDRALGFDSPAATGSSCGKYFSKESVGHLGFTGTSFWMDLEKRLVVVLLTNRVHPSRENTAIKTFRPKIHDAVMTSLGFSAV